MLFIIDFKTNNVPIFMKLSSETNDGTFSIIGNILKLNKNKFKKHDNIIYVDGLSPFIMINQSNIMFSNKSEGKLVKIYESRYNKYERIVEVDGQLSAIMVRTEDDLRNLIFGIEYPRKYIINSIIIDNKLRRSNMDRLIKNVTPTNIVVSLNSINQLKGKGEWFITTKIDGMTAVIAFIQESKELVAIELKQKKIGPEAKILLIKKVNEFLYDHSVVFMCEHYEGDFYLFLECNDKYGDYRKDLKNMKHFINNCNVFGITNVKLNNIIVAKKNETFRDITNKMTKLDLSKFPKTDGYVYGRISDKVHFKWKPVNQLTIDLLIKIINGFMYMYAGENKFNAIRRIKNDKRYIKDLRFAQKANKVQSPLIIGKKKYISQLWKIQKISKTKDGTIVDELHDKICEMSFRNGRWMFLRYRKDKTVPNNYSVCENMWKMIKNPIKFIDLL